MVNDLNTAREEGLNPKEAWWAGARAALGLDPNTPRTVVAEHLAKSAPTAPPDRDAMGRLVVEASGGEAVPDSVWEALQRMIEDGLVKGPASQEDARIVMQYRDRVRFLAAPQQSASTKGAAISPDRAALIELIEEHLYGVYHCGRVWEAWQVGTMTEGDFTEARGSDLAPDLADAILAATPAPLPQQNTNTQGAQE